MVAEGEIFAGQSMLLWPEDHGDPFATAQRFGCKRCEVIKPDYGLFCFAMRQRAGAQHERAIPHCLGQRGCLTRVCQQLGRADCGTSFAPMRFVRGNHGELREAEVRHRSRHGSDVQWIPWRYQDYVDAFAL